MKSVITAFVAALFLLLFSPVSAQVTFTKGKVFKKSYASSTIVAPPVLGKSKDGFFILSSGLMSAKRIVQLNLDENMNQAGEEIIVKLPKGKTVRRIFNFDHKMVVILWSGKKSDPFECYSYDHSNSALGDLILSIPVDDYPGREELEISLVNQEFNDFLAFSVRPKVEYAHVYRKVIVTSRTVDKMIWSQVVTDPFVNAAQLLGEFKLTDLYFNDAHTLVTRFSRPFLEEMKEEVLTDMYHFDGQKSGNVWHDQVIRSTEKEELLSLPLPYIDENDKVNVYHLLSDKERGSFDLIKVDIRGDEVERYALNSAADDLSSIKRVGLFAHMVPVNSDFEKGSFCFLVSEQLSQVELAYGNTRASHKHFVVSFKMDENGLSEDKIIDVGWPDAIWGELDGSIILSNSLDVIISGKMVNTDQKSVFDQCDQSAKKDRRGITYHYVIDGELFSFHSEYSTRNMTSQLVKWNF